MKLKNCVKRWGSKISLTIQPATSIDEAIAQMDEIIDYCLAKKSRLGFFAALYRQVTVQVKLGIEAGRFEDGDRMERLDVVFANRYFEALHQHLQGEKPTACWQAAFAAAPRWRPVVLQHLLLGMNAHINLDLGLSAAAVCPGPAIDELKTDFYEINTLLSELLDIIQARIGQFSPLLDLIDWTFGKFDEAIFRFSMEKARDAAWLTAEKFAKLVPDQYPDEIAKIDAFITELAKIVQYPGALFSTVAALVRFFELSHVPRIINLLNAPVGTD